jgi:hypothetical protein
VFLCESFSVICSEKLYEIVSKMIIDPIDNHNKFFYGQYNLYITIAITLLNRMPLGYKHAYNLKSQIASIKLVVTINFFIFVLQWTCFSILLFLFISPKHKEIVFDFEWSNAIFLYFYCLFYSLKLNVTSTTLSRSLIANKV